MEHRKENLQLVAPFINHDKTWIAAKGKELGWSDEQIQDATQVFNLAENQRNIENKEAHIADVEEDIKYWQKPTG